LGVIKIKRKVIQIAGSSFLVSLPKKWAVKYGVTKGDEVDVQEQNDTILISTNAENQVIKSELDITNLDPMVLRCIIALYKKGVDEIKVRFKDPSLIESVQKAIGKEAVGYEIIDQGENHCKIKHVSGEFEDFDPVLRRTLLLLMSMADESLSALKKGEFSRLKNIAFLEEANNRFTTSCRRFLNKKGHKEYGKTGPIYYVVEDLENLADEYKYMLNYLSQHENQEPLNNSIIKLYEETGKLMRTFYEIFYKFDKAKLVKIGNTRKQFVKKAHTLFEGVTDKRELKVVHHLLVIMQKIFNLVGPILIYKL
jgi:phosphate uptake regulator